MGAAYFFQVGNPPPTSPASNPLLEHNFWRSFVELLAGAFLTVGGFSILLGFPEFTNYVTARLKDIVLEKKYLKTLSRSEQNDIKNSIDENIFGVDTKDHASVYYFVNKKFSEMYTSPFRTDYDCELHFDKYESDDNFWKLKIITKYYLWKNLKAKKDPNGLSVDDNFTTFVPENIKDLKDILLSVCVNIGGDTLKYNKDVDSAGNPVNPMLVPETSPKNKRLLENIDMEFKNTVDDGRTYLEYKYSVGVNDTLYDDYNRVLVNIETEMLFHKKEHILTLVMTYPTKNLRLSCHFKDDNYRLEGAAFGFEEESHVFTSAKNYASAWLSEWIVPGHGAVMSWVSESNA